MGSLSGNTALITGGVSGIGMEVARHFKSADDAGYVTGAEVVVDGGYSL